MEPSVQNGERILKALREFGFGSAQLNVDDFSKPGKTIQLGYEPIRIDILTEIDGCKFSDAWENRKRGKLGPINVPFIGLQQLIRNKKSTGRAQDRADLEVLALCVKKKR